MAATFKVVTAVASVETPERAGSPWYVGQIAAGLLAAGDVAGPLDGAGDEATGVLDMTADGAAESLDAGGGADEVLAL